MKKLENFGKDILERKNYLEKLILFKDKQIKELGIVINNYLKKNDWLHLDLFQDLLLNKIGGALFRIPLFQDNSTLFPSLRANYNAQILDQIAWMGVIIPTLIWLLYGLFKIKQTNHLVITLLVILTIWFALTPSMIIFGESNIAWLEGHNLKIMTLLITKFTRGRFRLLPGLGYGLPF